MVFFTLLLTIVILHSSLEDCEDITLQFRFVLGLLIANILTGISSIKINFPYSKSDRLHTHKNQTSTVYMETNIVIRFINTVLVYNTTDVAHPEHR